MGMWRRRRNERLITDARRLEQARQDGLVIVMAPTYTEMAHLESELMLALAERYDVEVVEFGDYWRGYRATEREDRL